MTIGQRIAQKRKELSLSQEALGEALGVSRQSIYKWESDAALPEIDKLIALSGLFGVSVGWLLGVEEETPQPDPEVSDELTETQLKMVEEIVERYLAAQPKPKARKWTYVLAGFALLIAGLSLVNRLDEINQQYHRIQMTVSNVQDSVSSQINGISNRVEEILKSQNNLTAEYDTEIATTDLTRNTITFSMKAVPKTYSDGMTAVFLADSGDGPLEFSAELSSGRAFTGEATVVLTDSIVLSAVFIHADGTRETQVLDTYEGEYSRTLPVIDLSMDNFWGVDFAEPGIFTIPAPDGSPVRYVLIDPNQKGGITHIEEIQVGLFKNQTLVAWGVPCEQPDSFQGFDAFDFYELPDLTLPLTKTDTLCTAAIVTDQYGRVTVCPGSFYTLDESGTTLTHLSYSDPYSTYTDPSNWTFE